MADRTADFIDHPLPFLEAVPLMVGVPLDANFGTATPHFRVVESEFVGNSREGGDRPCDLVLDPANASPLTAYWCPYRPDAATTLAPGAAADFLFTANMTGCTFLVTGSGTGMARVSHSNAQTIGDLIHQHLGGDRGRAAIAQKGLQKLMGQQALGAPVTARHSFGSELTTIVGVRNTGTGSWSFHRQVLSVDGTGMLVSLQSLTAF